MRRSGAFFAVVFIFLLAVHLPGWAEIKLSGTSSTPSAVTVAGRQQATAEKKGEITFRLTMKKKADVEIDIYNAKGKKVAVIKKVLPPGPGIIVWNCGAVPPGTFQARVKVDGVEKKSRITVAK